MSGVIVDRHIFPSATYVAFTNHIQHESNPYSLYLRALSPHKYSLWLHTEQLDVDDISAC